MLLMSSSAEKQSFSPVAFNAPCFPFTGTSYSNYTLNTLLCVLSASIVMLFLPFGLIRDPITRLTVIGINLRVCCRFDSTRKSCSNLCGRREREGGLLRAAAL